MRAKFVTIILSLIWGVAYLNWNWNGWAAFFFAAFCAGGIASLFRMGNTTSTQPNSMETRGSINSNRNIMGKVCKNSVCGYQNGWTVFKCRKCGRFLGL